MNKLDLFDTWSNGGCLGYAIKALEASGYKPKEIQVIIDAMKAQFERYTVAEADRHYCNSVY
jgi:Holliday junction resolvasome RuvABC DNA-binding subunit